MCFHLQVTHPKTDEQRQRLQEVCRDILLFKNLDPVSFMLKKSLTVCFLEIILTALKTLRTSPLSVVVRMMSGADLWKEKKKRASSR